MPFSRRTLLFVFVEVGEAPPNLPYIGYKANLSPVEFDVKPPAPRVGSERI